MENVSTLEFKVATRNEVAPTNQEIFDKTKMKLKSAGKKININRTIK